MTLVSERRALLASTIEPASRERERDWWRVEATASSEASSERERESRRERVALVAALAIALDRVEGESRDEQLVRGYLALTPSILRDIERVCKRVGESDYPTIGVATIEASTIDRLALWLSRAERDRVEGFFENRSRRIGSIYRAARSAGRSARRGGAGGAPRSRYTRDQVEMILDLQPEMIVEREGVRTSRKMIEPEREVLASLILKSERVEGSIYGTSLDDIGDPLPMYGEPRALVLDSDHAILDRVATYGEPEREAPSLARLSFEWSIERSDVEGSRRDSIITLAALDALASTKRESAPTLNVTRLASTLGLDRGTIRGAIERTLDSDRVALALHRRGIESRRAHPVEPASSEAWYSTIERASRREGEYPRLFAVEPASRRESRGARIEAEIEDIRAALWLALLDDDQRREREAHAIERESRIEAERERVERQRESEASSEASRLDRFSIEYPTWWEYRIEWRRASKREASPTVDHRACR